MSNTSRSQPPDAPKPATGEPTRPVPHAGRMAHADDEPELELAPAPDDPWDDPGRSTLPMGDVPPHFAAATVQPARRPALRRQATDSGLGAGVPGPSFGGDTDFDATDEHPTFNALRQTASFDSRPKERIALLSEPPSHPLDLPLDDESAGEALDLVGRHDDAFALPNEPPPAADPMADLRERYALGDFSGALTVAESLLEDDPNNADVQRYAESCRDVLQQMYMARLGALDQVPIVAVPAEQLRWLTLDHRAGFLLSHVDGVSTLEEILDISGMPHLEAMRLIYELLQQKVIVFQ